MIEKQPQDLESYFLIKGRFKGANSNKFGLFILFLSLSQKAIDNVFVAASHYSSVYELSPSSPWNLFEEKIIQFKWQGETIANTSNDLQLLLLNTIKADIIDEFIDAINTNNLHKVEHTLMGIISKGVLDKSLSVEVKAEKVSYTDIIRVKDERARKEKEEREAKEREEVRKIQESRYKVEDGAVILPINLVLAPVSGIPIYDITANEMIMIKLDATTEKGNYFIDLLNARGPNGEIIPLKSVVKDIIQNSLGEYELLVEIGPGIYGKNVEREKVKVKKYELNEERIKTSAAAAESPDKATKKIPVKSSSVGQTKDYFIWLVGAITFLLAILIMYLIFSGIL
ncbi:MAG: hypothetical protein PHF84_07875 [bacterium]|nr:hypothetical protein [bacterium]